MCIFVAYYIAETNTINIFTNKTKTIMKYKLLRFSLLSVLVMLFSGLVYAAATDNPYKHIFSTTEKTFTTDETQNLSGVDWTLTTTWFDNSKKDYNKDADWGMKLGSNSKPIQSLTLTSKEGDIPGTITSVKVSGKIRSGAAVNMSVTVGGVAFTPADAAMSKDGSELEFTGSGTGSVVIACNTTSAANKSGAIYIRDITIAYENGGQTDTRVATSITLVNPTTTAAVGDVVALPSAELKAADESNITDAVITWESSDETVAAFEDNTTTGMKELKALKTGTATITASYAGNTTYKASSASFTLTVKEYTQYTTIASMLENITSTKTDIKYTFSGIAVTYVNGKYTYIYKSGDGVILLYGDNLGLEAGCVYNGSLVGQLYAFNGLPEIAVSANDINVEKQEGMVEVGINIITPDELPYYINKQCAIQNAEYVSTASGNMTFTVGDKEFIVRNSFGIDLPELTAGKKYTVEGFGAVYAKNDNTTYQLYPTNVTEEQETPAGFRDIKIDLTQHSELLTESDVYITVAEDGTIGTTDNAENAAATIKGKVHGSYGSANFTASVPVQGCVKITYATHDYGNDIIVTNSEGAEVAKLNTMGDKWMSNHDNVAVTYYRTNEPTTLNFSKANYNPYFAVEAIDPADLPAEVTSYNITFAAGEGVTGTVPAALEVEAGGKFTAPKNYTLYKEGYTLNGWESGDAIYLPGQEITPEADMTLTAHFVQNEVNLADRTETVAIDFTLNGTTGQYKFEGNTGFMVTQATVNGKTIDVKADINATGGKFAYNGSGWHQVNQGTKVIVPSCKGAIIKVATYNNATSVTFNGEAGTADENTAVFTAATETATVEIAQVASNYWNSLSIVLPVEEKEQKLYIAGNNTSTGWCTDNPDEMTFNAETQKFEYVMDFNGATYFTITTGKTETPDDWETFGTYRLGIGAGDQDVTTDTEYQLANYSNGTFVLQGNGKYLISVTSDLKMTITMIPTLEANQMEKQEDGTYKKAWSNVELPVGTIEYKIVKDGNTWIPGGDNLSYSITEAGTYNVIVTFNPQTEEASMTTEAQVPHEPVVLTWDYTEANIPTKGPDNGLYYGAYVNDAAGTNNGMHGVKLNSSGYAFFAKPAVAGKLTLTFGNRKTADAYAVNVYACTIADGVATKGDLIGEVAIEESPGTGSIDIAADVTGIYIERKTTAEGVLSKIVFKEIVPRSFVDFEITNEQMMTDGFDGSTLPAGVTFSGTHRGDSHGYGNVTLTVPVDGTVRFTIGGCQYANPANCKVTNAEGEVLATPLLKTTTCYHQDGAAATYIYIGEPTTLTFSDIAYLPYFKAEATEVQEAVITYKDQNGEVLGKKTVYEGDAIGEIPYTEADLTIPEGEKFRGWVYNSKIKVKATDIVTGNISILASVTPIEEAPTVGSIQTYDLTQATFYPEDHENFSVENGAYYNNHGFDFAAGGSFTVATTGKAQIVLTLCQYGNGTTIQVVNAEGTVVSDNVPAKAETDGGTAIVNYEGPAGTLKFTFAAQTYLHKVTVYNVSDFLAKDESGYYIVPAGDAAGLVLALNAASAEPNTRIFLPNGTYDFGEATLTGISGENVSIIGQSADKTIIVNRPPRTMEGLGKADLLNNTGVGLYMQDLTLKNDMESLGNDERAATLHDQGTKTINKNVRHLSHQDTYYSHKVGGLYYFEGGEMHGTVDYLCGNGKVYFNEVKLVNERRNSSTITANSELYVFNNCVVENNADQYNFGRAWSDHPVCVYLNTTLMDGGEKLISTRWNPSGINCDYSIAGEFGTKNAEGQDITPASNEVTFVKESTTLQTILTAEQAATYTMEYVLGDWAATAKQEARQLTAPPAEYANGTVTWPLPDDGSTAFMIEKNGEFVGITIGSRMDVTINAETDVLTIRSANGRGGFGPAAQVAGTATSIKAIHEAMERGEQVIYNLSGQRVNKATKGLYIINGRKVVVK